MGTDQLDQPSCNGSPWTIVNAVQLTGEIPLMRSVLSYSSWYTVPWDCPEGQHSWSSDWWKVGKWKVERYSLVQSQGSGSLAEMQDREIRQTPWGSKCVWPCSSVVTRGRGGGRVVGAPSQMSCRLLVPKMTLVGKRKYWMKITIACKGSVKNLMPAKYVSS